MDPTVIDYYIITLNLDVLAYKHYINMRWALQTCMDNSTPCAWTLTAPKATNTCTSMPYLSHVINTSCFVFYWQTLQKHSQKCTATSVGNISLPWFVINYKTSFVYYQEICKNKFLYVVYTPAKSCYMFKLNTVQIVPMHNIINLLPTMKRQQLKWFSFCLFVQTYCILSIQK